MASAERDVLPSAIKPKHYSISLYDVELGGKFTYQGTVVVDLKISEPVKQITVNAIQLKLFSASIGGKLTENVSYDEPNQRATFSFPDEIQPGDASSLEIKFQGVMANNMAGFYRSKYKPAVTPAASVPEVDGYHYMFSTQFESSDARRAIPCFDEPNLKSTFDFEIEIPEDQTALSNMPEKATRPGSKGRKVVSFETTPVMSTYLLAWAFGDFEYVEDFTKRKYNGKNLPVRVYTTRGLKEQGRFGLEHAHQIVDLFSDVFQFDYPLPKVDLLAVHEFSHGAMENWGLITYRTTAILFDEKSSDASYRNRVAYVVAHELAHQWFGNLVTMDWWNDLWLNEGFATWVGWYAIDNLHPDWEVWSQFVAEAIQRASELDSLRSSHPIEVPVKNSLEIDQVFDAISYLKGSSVIRMLAKHLDEKVFLQGVAEYIKAHAYGNATTNDLWAALTKVSGQDVNHFMDPWIRKVGFPVLTVAEEPGQIGLKQQRFLSTGDVSAQDDETTWWIPLGLKHGSASVTASALTAKEETIRDVDTSFYKLNTDTAGFYRTNYPPNRLVELGKARDKLSVTDSIGLIGDASALAISGEGTSAGLLSLCAEYGDEKNYLIWKQLLSSIGTVRSIFGTDAAIAAGLKKWVLQLVEPTATKLGWEFAADEGFLTGQLRALIISAAGGAGHEATIAKAQQLFKEYTSGKKDVMHPSLRLPVFRIAVETGGKEAYEAVKNEYLTTTAVDGREICLIAMGRVQSTELVTDFLDFQFAEVAIQDMHTGAISLAQNAKVRNALWEYIKANWSKVDGKLATNNVVIDRFLKQSLSKFSDSKIGNDIDTFFKDKDTKAFDKGLAQTQETIGSNAKYKERDEKLVLEWLQAHGFA